MDKPIKKVSLNTEEVRSILVACYQAGVKSLKFLNLQVEFHENSNATAKNMPIPVGDAIPTANPEKIAKKAFRQEVLQTKQEQLDQMLIEDPAQYEHLVLAGELEDAESDHKRTE